MNLQSKVNYATSNIKLISRHYDQPPEVRNAALDSLVRLIEAERKHIEETYAAFIAKRTQELSNAS